MCVSGQKVPSTSESNVGQARKEKPTEAPEASGWYTLTDLLCCNAPALDCALFRCKICKVFSNSKQAFDMHVKGKKHQEALKASGT